MIGLLRFGLLILASLAAGRVVRTLFSGSGPFTRPSTPDDLKGVGSWKPMGYLAACQIEDFGLTVGGMKEELQARGVKTYWADSPSWIHPNNIWSGGPGGALFACDIGMLQGLLDENRAVVEGSGWPTEPEAFMRRVATDDVREASNPKLYRVIGLAFADPRFSS
jgi:hypothetical protein